MHFWSGSDLPGRIPVLSCRQLAAEAPDVVGIVLGIDDSPPGLDAYRYHEERVEYVAEATIDARVKEKRQHRYVCNAKRDAELLIEEVSFVYPHLPDRKRIIRAVL